MISVKRMLLNSCSALCRRGSIGAFAVLSVLVVVLMTYAAAQVPVTIAFEQPIHDANYPELLYWFITPETFAPGRVAEDIDHIANDTPFTFPFLTERMSVRFLKDPKPDEFVPPSCPEWPPWCVSFSGNSKSHEVVSEIVRDAHAKGLKIGMTFDWMVVDTQHTIPLAEDQTVVSSAE